VTLNQICFSPRLDEWFGDLASIEKWAGNFQMANRAEGKAKQ